MLRSLFVSDNFLSDFGVQTTHSISGGKPLPET